MTKTSQARRFIVDDFPKFRQARLTENCQNGSSFTVQGDDYDQVKLLSDGFSDDATLFEWQDKVLVEN